MAKPRSARLWRCPKCGHRFVTANMYHSCGRYRIADHFKGKPAELRRIYRAFLQLARDCGPVLVYAEKTRIAFQVDVRFAGVTVRSNWVVGGMWFREPAAHPTLIQTLRVTPRDYVHYFKLSSVDDVDAALGALMRKAYATGCREHLDRGTKS